MFLLEERASEKGKCSGETYREPIFLLEGCDPQANPERVKRFLIGDPRGGDDRICQHSRRALNGLRMTGSRWQGEDDQIGGFNIKQSIAEGPTFLESRNFIEHLGDTDSQ